MGGVHGPFAMRFLVVHQVSQAVESEDSAAETRILWLQRPAACALAAPPYFNEVNMDGVDDGKAENRAIFVSADRL